MTAFSKPPKTISEQIELLASRGLLIPDRDKAEHYLRNISYYRLSAYMLVFQRRDGTHRFDLGTTFDQVLQLYVFDRALRVHMFDAIERVEVAIRARIIQRMAEKHGSHWHENPAHFRIPQTHEALMREIREVCARERKEVFIEHYLRTYSRPELPASWMCFETLTMGSLSKIYKGIKENEDRKAIADTFSLPKEVLQKWLHSLSYVRNICAHHSRLWNRELAIAPAHLTARSIGPWITGPHPENDRIYYTLCCLRYLLQSINPKGSFTRRTKELLEKYRGVPLASMGFQADWEQQPLWSEAEPTP